MNSTLEYFVKNFGVDLSRPSPISLRHSRYRMVDSIRELGFTEGAEIGTEHGVYAEKICAGNPQVRLHCVDSYLVYPYYDVRKKDQDEINTFYEAAKKRLAPYNAEIIKATSMQAVQQFEDNSLDFVFIDANHYLEFVINDIIYWSRKVRPGGIVYGHDYNEAFHVIQAVNAYMSSYKVAPWFVLHKGGRLIDCWMFVRQEEDRIWSTSAF